MKVLMDKTGSIKILKGHTKCKGKKEDKVIKENHEIRYFPAAENRSKSLFGKKSNNSWIFMFSRI